MMQLARLHQAKFEAEVLVRLGMRNMLMPPPLVITEAEVDGIIKALDQGFASL